MAKKLSAEVWEQRVNEAGAGRYEFVRWEVDGEFGSQKKCVIRCVKDGYEWSAKVSNLVTGGKGCPQCAGLRRWTAEERIGQINELKNIEFISWVGSYKNNKSNARLRCAVDGFEWRASVSSLVNGGFGCPSCAGNRRCTDKERIEQINKIENVEFVSWVNEYESNKSKVIVRCIKDGFEWYTTAQILMRGHGCPHCACNRRWTSEERIEQINRLYNIEFVSWVDGYKNGKSKANVRCTIDDYEWRSSANMLVSNGSRCAKCAKFGYDPGKTGTLYAMRSECGQYIKVGISNEPKRRHKQLEKRTPFKFNLIEQISGDGAKIAALEKYFHNKYERAGFTGFDGCTEWLICTPELLEELRNLGDKL